MCACVCISILLYIFNYNVSWRISFLVLSTWYSVASCIWVDISFSRHGRLLSMILPLVLGDHWNFPVWCRVWSCWWCDTVLHTKPFHIMLLLHAQCILFLMDFISKSFYLLLGVRETVVFIAVISVQPQGPEYVVGLLWDQPATDSSQIINITHHWQCLVLRPMLLREKFPSAHFSCTYIHVGKHSHT